MEKSVLISIKPKWCEMIANGKKTIELRKSRPKLETPFKCYIYCTFPQYPYEDFISFNEGTENFKALYGGGKVIGEFVCDDIDEVSVHYDTLYCVNNTQPKKLTQMRLTLDEVIEYLGEKNHGYTWHISNLKIYDTPKELSNFLKPCPYGDVSCFLCDKSGYNADMYIDCFNTVDRPPQSWMYVSE